MRFIKILVLIVVLVVIVLFFMQNTDVLGQYISLGLGMPGSNALDPESLHWELPTMPLYAAILGAFVLGALLSLLSSLLTRIRIGSELRRANRRARDLELEVNSLRKLPLQKSATPSQGQSQNGHYQSGQSQSNGQAAQSTQQHPQ